MDKGKLLDNGKIVTPMARFSFPKVFKPDVFVGKDGKPKGDPKYSVVLLFSNKADLKILKKEAKRVRKAEWGSKSPKNLGDPFSDGDDKDEEQYPGYAGMTVVTATSNKKPNVFDADGDPIEDESEIYGGCYGRAVVVAFAYDNVGKGVSFGLRSVKKIKDGEPLGGGSSKAEDYDDVDDDDDDDDIPF